jgi:hypothetical protein
MLACFVSLFGCKSTPVTQTGAADHSASAHYSNTASCRTPGGRSVVARGDMVSVGIQRQGEMVDVRLGEVQFDAAAKMSVDHTVTFEREKVLLDGKERARISTSANDLEVICTTNKLSVMAGKELLFAARMDKWHRNNNDPSSATTVVR